MLNASIAGTVGRDAENRVAGQTNVTGWSVAVEQRGKDGKVTQWINCSMWGKRGETLSQYIQKGGKMACTGELTTREYNGKTYRFVVNGRTGRVQGERPYSAWKISIAVVIGLAIAGAIGFVMANQ